MLDLSELPQGQRRAIEALIGDGVDQTYTQAAKIAGMAEGTLRTHVNGRKAESSGALQPDTRGKASPAQG